MKLDALPGAQDDGIGPSSMPSMEGLLSRQSIAHRQWKDDNESSDSENDDSTQAQPSKVAGVMQESARPVSPASPGSPPKSPPGTPGAALAALKASSVAPPPLVLSAEDKDRRIRDLETENQSLRARIAILERANGAKGVN
jgi:hypothetical protein